MHRDPPQNFQIPEPSVDVDGILRSLEQRHVVDTVSGTIRYDISEFDCNKPSEDSHAEMTNVGPTGAWSFFSVFDGHNGQGTSTYLRDNLHNSLLSNLTNHDPASGEAFDNVIKDTFKSLDERIVNGLLGEVFKSKSRANAVRALGPAMAGSAALLTMYDAETRLLRVALAGDVRAVLGRRTSTSTDHTSSSESKYKVHLLSKDQNGLNPAEKSRIEALHPNEPDLIQGKRVAGIAVSRSFGDGLWKWPLDVQGRLHKEYLGREPFGCVKTPPYLIAEPEVTTAQIRRGDFMIIATDGLWDALSNEEAVGLVGAWLDDMNKKEHPIERNALPVGPGEEDKTENYGGWHAKKLFMNIDENAATHLIRNALGGADRDLTEALMSIGTPRSRYYMDDITVTVVFFGDFE
ncbi:protein serine/threonine phosphatase 2C [Rickenella mellea]|uniref:Protein serine/threonine phosphatase 2C n=1 Tax=Rickenella mellea TaxID=50990 RepID=A0A4Y7PMR2_9AGAM|nr:protein serine/threonine phosphatase 2C [Rickenella mellea]